MSFKTYSLEEIISHARANSPYYAALYKDLPQDATLEQLPLVDSTDFWNHCDKSGGTVATGPHLDGQIFKSGGTTGIPKYSLYSAEEWQTMCECSGALLSKGGLSNGARIANLFYAGGLYASFLYMYSMLYFAPAKTLVYNLSGNISIEEMATTIVEHKINCVAGLPSMITKIVSYYAEHGIKDTAIDTIYFAGETMYQDQRDQICRILGKPIEFRSVFYASNDGGPIGYFTKDCGFNEHRVMSDLCLLELIDPDTGEVITEVGRPGIIYITSLFKTLIPLIRYPAGDFGEYTEPEGNPDRKFRILGRSNVAARAGYVTIYPEDIGHILNMCGVDYFAYQIIVKRDGEDYFTFKIAVADPDAAQSHTQKFMQTLCQERPLVQDALDQHNMLPPVVQWCKTTDLTYNPRTGKLKVILDERLS